MKIHEYQGKEILRRYAVPVPRGIPCFSVDEAVKAAQELGGPVWVVKAQIHAGGRGKGGGVKLAKTIDEVRSHASNILGMMLKTHQTGPDGQKVRRLLIEEGADIRKELYLGIVLDRLSQKICVMASSEGGMDIEEVAAKTPEKLHKVFCDVEAGLTDSDANDLCAKIGIPPASISQGRAVLQGLYKAFYETDASLAEINPLILTGDGKVIALDAKMNFDSNALFRHPEIVEMRDLDEEEPAEIEASKFDLAYIQLDGNIGCLVNGAGLAMATMDTIKLFGGEPANFLDVGGGATTEKVTEAFKIMLRNPGLRAILVNIFGGIMRCDTIAEGVIAASKAVGLSVPLVVRMKGTNEDIGKKMLADSGLPIISANTMAEAAQRVVSAAAGKSRGEQTQPAVRRVTKPVTTVAVAKSGSPKAVGKNPAEKATAATKPAATKAAAKKSAAKKPATKKPATKKPAAKKPAAKKPATKKPATKNPAAKKPVVKKPAVKKATVKKPVARKPVAKKSAARNSAAPKKSIASKPALRKPPAASSKAGKTAAKKTASKKSASTKVLPGVRPRKKSTALKKSLGKPIAVKAKAKASAKANAKASAKARVKAKASKPARTSAIAAKSKRPSRA